MSLQISYKRQDLGLEGFISFSRLWTGRIFYHAGFSPTNSLFMYMGKHSRDFLTRGGVKIPFRVVSVMVVHFFWYGRVERPEITKYIATQEEASFISRHPPLTEPDQLYKPKPGPQTRYLH
jgi:hypothetical protein